MGLGGAMLALSGVQAIASIGQGYATNQQDKYNAQLYDQQAQTIGIQGSIQQGQITRTAGEAASTATAKAGGAGLQPTGSVAAVILSTQTQYDTDKAIAQYNTTTTENTATQQATQLRNQGNAAVYSGYSSAFSDMLKGTVAYGLYNGTGGGGFNPNTFGTDLITGGSGGTNIFQ